MYLRVIFFCLISLCLGCAILFDNGVFKSDEEMIDFLVKNIDTFNLFVESKEECNDFYAENSNARIRTEECQKLFNFLDLTYANYFSYLKNDGSNELVERIDFGKLMHMRRYNRTEKKNKSS